MTSCRCEITGNTFTVSDAERELRAKFGFDDLPKWELQWRFRELGAFWPHWNLHKRTCDKTGRSIISIFRPDCPFPVWDRSEWIASASPPDAAYDPDRPFFEQAWELFKRCPLPHTFQSHNENCEYADDFYHSKDCYLCHSSGKLQDCRYCYYCDECRDSQFLVYSSSCELCSDVTNSSICYQTVYAAYCQNINNCSFVYDCRGCSDCMFCCNLRGKRFCFENVQLSEAEYRERTARWDLRSRTVFEQAKVKFQRMLLTEAWHEALDINFCENCTGNYLMHSKNCEDCFLSPHHEDCVHDAISGPHARSTLDSLGTIGSELVFYTVMCVYSYQVRFSFELNECKFCDYCMYCFHCKNCFGCCGLVGEEFCIFNRRYAPDDYYRLREEIISGMKARGAWGRFFPGHFAPNPFDESCSSFFFPLKPEEQERFGFRTAPPLHRRLPELRPAEALPDSIADLLIEEELEDRAAAHLCSQGFWDSHAGRPFRLTKEDLQNSLRFGVPLLNSFYIRRIQQNFGLIPFDGTMRATRCAHTGEPIKTSWPKDFDGRILSKAAYLAMIG